MGLFIFALIGCENPPEGDDLTIVLDPKVDECCAEEYTAKISGSAPASGMYYWLGLMDNDTLVRYGDSVFIPSGPYINVPLSVKVAYHDNLPGGDYNLRVFEANLPEDVGIVAKRTVAAEAGIVQVPSYTFDECRNCYQIEIRYRTFIACEVISDLPADSIDDFSCITKLFVDYFKGDNRGFNDTIGTSRSHQRFTIYYDLVTGAWETDSLMEFGETRRYASSDVTHVGGACPFSLNEGAEPNCANVAFNGDNNGSIMTATFEEFGPNSSKLKMNLEGFHPCTNILNYAPCGIDGHLEFEFAIDNLNRPLYKFRLIHDGYPWHELYINSVEIYTHDPNETGYNTLSLCPDLFLCNDSGDIVWNAPDWVLVPNP